ncbi:sporulation protein YqfD [Domibacillus robiginosus]|uniref:sporulation protein YqfD n=1 Tax=Domibacillus robiginosus TaxID=1071054 RepID=UPI00067B9C4D|nr:sporulation protein YqfD [Domibacillus robiginosus]
MADFFLKGAVTVLVRGEEAPLFPGRLHQRGVTLKNLQYSRQNEVQFSLCLEDLGKLRQEARHFKGKVRFKERTGLPFLKKRIMRFTPFLLTSICFFILMILLSAMIIRIDIQGADAELERDIRTFLKKEGVREGAIQLHDVNTEEISRRAVQNIPGVVRFLIQKKGVVYVVDVSSEKPPALDTAKTRHVRAAKSGVVHDMFIKYGVAEIRRGDFVEAGDPLIKGTKKKPAAGTVTAETWYKATVTLGGNALKTRNGEKRKHIFFSIGEKEYSLWDPSSLKGPVQTEENRYSFHFFSYQLPFSLRTETDYSLKRAGTVESEAEQEKRVIQAAKAALMAKLPKEAVITGENVLQKRAESGKVKVIIHFQVLENIAIH